MTKEIIVSVAGIQFEVDDSEAIEIITTGEYYYRNGKHYILYEEKNEGQELIKNRIKITPDCIEMKKSGAVTATMIFRQGESHTTRYSTDVGILFVRTVTNSILFSEREDFMYAKILYSMEINDVHISECSVEIKVRPR